MRRKQWKNRRLKLEEAVLLGTILPLQCFLSKPVSFSQAAQVDRLSIGHVFPGHINLVKGGKCKRRRVKQKNSVTRWKMGK